jgi:hypothetical protein
LEVHDLHNNLFVVMLSVDIQGVIMVKVVAPFSRSFPNLLVASEHLKLILGGWQIPTLKMFISSRVKLRASKLERSTFSMELRVFKSSYKTEGATEKVYR